MVKVAKFGGSSLASAEQFRKVADIILADSSRRYVVPSAPGKRFADDVKVTDMLYSCYKAAISGGDFEGKFKDIKARYDSIISSTFFLCLYSPCYEISFGTAESPKIQTKE